MTDLYRLNYEIKQSGLKLGSIAKDLGISRAALYNKLNGHSEFYGSEISKLSSILNLNTEDRELIFFKKEVDNQ